MVIGITGHQKLQEEESWSWVREAIRSALSQAPRPVIGLSSLAIGADQLFAELILECEFELHVVLPFPAYAETFKPGRDMENYSSLLRRASSVEVLPALPNKEESYLAAGQRVVDLSGRMIAVWNGKQAVGLGGTGDIVEYALGKSKEVLHVNPISKTINLLLTKGLR